MADEIVHRFETIAVAALLDQLCAAVDAARIAAAGNQRWLNAIDAAWDHLLTVESVEYRARDHALIYHSESGQTYTANGRCQCEAYRNGRACKHRAAARIVFRALELTPPPPVLDLAVEARALRDELLSARDLATDFDGTGAVAEAARVLPDALAFAAAWDADAARQKAQALGGRLAAARGRILAQVA